MVENNNEQEKPHYSDSSGVLGSIIFMIVVITAMFVISKFMGN